MAQQHTSHQTATDLINSLNNFSSVSSSAHYSNRRESSSIVDKYLQRAINRSSQVETPKLGDMPTTETPELTIKLSRDNIMTTKEKLTQIKNNDGKFKELQETYQQLKVMRDLANVVEMKQKELVAKARIQSQHLVKPVRSNKKATSIQYQGPQNYKTVVGRRQLSTSTKRNDSISMQNTSKGKETQETSVSTVKTKENIPEQKTVRKPKQVLSTQRNNLHARLQKVKTKLMFYEKQFNFQQILEFKRMLDPQRPIYKAVRAICLLSCALNPKLPSQKFETWVDCRNFLHDNTKVIHRDLNQIKEIGDAKTYNVKLIENVISECFMQNPANPEMASPRVQNTNLRTIFTFVYYAALFISIKERQPQTSTSRTVAKQKIESVRQSLQKQPQSVRNQRDSLGAGLKKMFSSVETNRKTRLVKPHTSRLSLLPYTQVPQNMPLSVKHASQLKQQQEPDDNETIIDMSLMTLTHNDNWQDEEYMSRHSQFTSLGFMSGERGEQELANIVIDTDTREGKLIQNDDLSVTFQTPTTITSGQESPKEVFVKAKMQTKYNEHRKAIKEYFETVRHRSTGVDESTIIFGDETQKEKVEERQVEFQRSRPIFDVSKMAFIEKLKKDRLSSQNRKSESELNQHRNSIISKLMGAIKTE